MFDKISLFQGGTFVLSSGRESSFKIECDALTQEDWETLGKIAAQITGPINQIDGPGGRSVEFRQAIEAALPIEKKTEEKRILLVDDVLTTGRSMENLRADYKDWQVTGIVVFARGRCPDWIVPIFQMTPGV